MEAGARWAAGADCCIRHHTEEHRASGSLRRLTMATETQESAKLAQLAHENPDEIEIAAGREREQLEGWIPTLASDTEIREALEKAFDYRGDITITRKDGSQIVGYLFDRRSGSSLADSFVRIIPANAPAKVNIAYSDISALAFTWRATAAGD